MSEDTGTVHPLFAPFSLYGRMRACVRAEDKMRGFFHWLWARAKREAQPLPNGYFSSTACASDATMPLVDQGKILDVWPAQARLVMAGTALRLACLPYLAVSLYLVHEPDGKNTLGCRAGPTQLTGHPEVAGWASRPCPCRAFLLEPEVVERLGALLAGKPWQEAFSAETIANNGEVARVLAAAPELEGEVGPDEIHFERVPVPERYNTFPPRKELLQVVIVCDTPSAERSTA